MSIFDKLPSTCQANMTMPPRSTMFMSILAMHPVGTLNLKDEYVRNIPLPRVPREQKASPELTAPKDSIQLPDYSLPSPWIPTLPKLGNVLEFSQKML